MARTDNRSARRWPYLVFLALFLCGSLALAASKPAMALWIGLSDGLSVGIILGVIGFLPDYDSSWDEFWESTALSYLFGIFAVLIYWARRERPSTFFLVQSAAGTISYLMLLFVPVLPWLGADFMLFAGTFAGWLLSGIFRSDHF